MVVEDDDRGRRLLVLLLWMVFWMMAAGEVKGTSISVGRVRDEAVF